MDASLFTTIARVAHDTHDVREARGVPDEPASLPERGHARVLRFAYADAARLERAALAALLGESELADVRRFALPELRDRALLRRAFVRTALGLALSVPPRRVALRKGRRGKPEIDAGTARVSMSLSHTDDVALLAIGHDLHVGVDVERAHAPIDPELLARVVLHEDEARAFSRLDGDARKRCVLGIGCRKEAALKVTGIGLLDDLTTLSVMPDEVSLGACRDARVTPEDACVVRITDLDVGAAHRAALATAPPA